MTTTWSLPETDSRTVESVLEELLERSQALAAHLVDRSGQLIASAGNSGYDLESFASLAAADLSANDELARLIGEPHVDGVACIGSLRSMASTQVGENLVLCVVFDRHPYDLASRPLEPVYLGASGADIGRTRLRHRLYRDRVGTSYLDITDPDHPRSSTPNLHLPKNLTISK